MMKKRSKAIALMTTAAMLASFLSAVPSFSAEENEKTAQVTIPDWSETLDYSDTEVELKTTTVTLDLNKSGTLSFNGIYNEFDPEAENVTKSFDDEGESGGYQFNIWDSKSDIVSAINQQKGLSLSEDSFVEITDLSIDYSWNYISTEEGRVPNVIVWSNVYGKDADGNDANGGTEAYYDTMTGSKTFTSAECEKAQSVDIIHGFSLNAGASTNNPNDVLEFSWDSITLTVRYSETSRGGWKSFESDGKDWAFDHYIEKDGEWIFSPVMEQVIAAIKAQESETVQDWTVKVNDISMDYEWTFNTAMEEPGIDFYTNAGGNDANGDWLNADPAEKVLTGRNVKGNVTASEIANCVNMDIADFQHMKMNIGAWTDNPNDTLTLSLTNITFDVTYQTESYNDDSSKYLSYEELGDAQYVSVAFKKSKIDKCGHDSHIGDDKINYFEGWTYCPWAIIFVTRISADGSRSETYSAFPGPADHESDICVINYSDIIDTTGALSEGDRLEFTCYEAAVITDLTATATLPDLHLETGKIIETTIEEGSDWDSTKGESVPSGKPDITPSITIASFGSAKAIKGYDAVKIDYTLKNPNKCSGIVVTLHGWENDSVGWDQRFYEANSSGTIIVDLSDVQDKTFHNIYVGPAALTTAQIGDSFTPCFEVTSAVMLASCAENATPQIAPIELPETPPADESRRKTVNVTIDTNWTDTVDFSGVDTTEGEFRHLFNDETQSGNWYIDKYVNDNLNPEILNALKEQTGDTPCEWPFVVNDITAVCEWALTTDESGSGGTGEVQFFPNTCGLTGEEVWRNTDNAEDPSYKFSEKTGSCNISASRIAALSDATDISDYFGMSLDMGTWSNDPSARLTLRITSVKFNVTYVPKNAKYLSYDELKDAKYVKIYSDVAKKTECGHGADHIGNDGVKYFDDWTYCPWTCVQVRRIDADGNVSNIYEARADQKDMASVTAMKKISDITAITGELSEGDVLEFAGSASETITKVETFDSLPDIQLDPITIDEVTIQEAGDWDPDLGEVVPNGTVARDHTELMHDNYSAHLTNDYPAVKINYTLENPDKCSAIVVILNGWDNDGTGWLMKCYPVNGNSGTIIADFSDAKDKTFYQVYAGVVARPTVEIGDTFTPKFTAEGVLMSSYTGKFTEEYNPFDSEAILAENIEVVENIYSEESDDPYILTKDELAAIEAVLENDYSK